MQYSPRPIFDAHTHLARWIKPWLTEDSDADTVTTAGFCGIKRLLVSCIGQEGNPLYPTPEEFRAANDHVLQAMERFPGVIYGYCYVSPQHPAEAIAELRRCIQDGPMVGIKLWVSTRASSPEVDPILKEALRLNVPVLQHSWYKTTGNLADESTPADVAMMAARHPEVSIQMAHLYGAGERGVQDIAPFPNVTIDTSGGEPEAGLLEYAVQELGAERVVYGSDVPGRDFATQLGKVMGADLTEEQRDLILYRNMHRLLGIEE